MAFRLAAGETVPDGLRRLVREQLSAARDGLRGLDQRPGEDDRWGEVIHDARTSLKKARAVVRLARDALGADVARREQRAYRDAARRLAEARDAEVLIGTLDALVAAGGGGVPAGPVAEARGVLCARERAAQEHMVAEGVIDEVAARLDAALERVGAWTLDNDGWGALAPGLERAYRHGRKLHVAAYADSQPERFHEWRKRVKDLWYHLRILEPVWPGPMRALVAEADHLADLLGLEHDLSILHAALADGLVPDEDAGGALIGLAEDRQATLRAEAAPLGARLYADRPGVFTRRVGAWWDAWRA